MITVVCSTTKQKDQECVSQSKEAEVFIKKTQEDIDDLNALLANIQQLRDSCVCALNNANDKIKTPTCSLKDIKIDSILDNLDLLDLVTLSDVKANMQLDKVIAADEIIFSSKIWLYGDWTNKLLKKRDELVIKNDLHIEEEKTKEGYTNGAKSLITLNHHVNFNSIELTAREMANQIEMIVCKEFNITNDISKKIQNSIVEFNLMDGNSTICPTYSKLDLSATSEGLYSDYIEKESSKDQNKGLGSYKYSFGKGRSKINVTEERIDNMNTLTYQQKINSPKDVSIIEGVTNDLSKTTTQPSIPVTDASVEYQINPDDKDSGSGTKEENSSSTNSAIEQSGAEVEYTQEVKEEQDSIDAQKVAQKS